MENSLKTLVSRMEFTKQQYSIFYYFLQLRRYSYSYPAKWPCLICKENVGSTSIYCIGSKYWLQDHCSGITENDLPFHHENLAHVLITLMHSHIAISDVNLKVVDSFSFLSLYIEQTGGCFDATAGRVQSMWKVF